MFARARAQRTAKPQRQPLSSTQRARLMQARAQVSQATRAQNQQFQTQAVYRSVRGLENKFFDPFTADGSKTIDCASNATVSNAAGGWILDTATAPGALVLNQIPQGTTQSSRIGRKAHLTGVRIRGYFKIQNANSAYAIAGLALVHQMTPNNPSAMPAYNTVWLAQAVGALRNVNDSDKLKILREIGPYKLTGDGDAASTGYEIQWIDEFIDIRKNNVITEWTTADTTGTYSNMEKGALLLYGLSDSTADTNFFGSVRVYFEDY